MNDYGKEVRRRLSEAGCWFLRHGHGDHDIWKSPRSRAVAEQLAKARSHNRRNRLPLRKNIVKVLARDSKKRRNFRPAATGGGNDHLAKKLAWMGGATVRITSGSVFGHQSLLVVSFKIDAAGILALELERDAPRTVDMHRIARRVEPSECIEVKAGEVHLLRGRRCVQTIKPQQGALMQTAIDLGGGPIEPQVCERLASEGPNHPIMQTNCRQVSSIC